MNKLNYASVVTNATQIVYDNMKKVIDGNLKLLKRKKNVIFGAGVRGNLLAMLLEEYGISDIIFVDNNEKLQGGRINNYLIHSIEEIVNLKDDIMVLVSPENNTEIINQLSSIGYIENKNLLNFGNKLYDWFMDKFDDSKKKEVFLVGDCGLMHFSLFDKVRESLGTMIEKSLKEVSIKTLTMNAMGMRAFYNILLVQLENYPLPKHVLLSVDISNFNGKQHFLPGSQHVDLIKRVISSTDYCTDELMNYVNVIEERYKKFNSELVGIKKAKSSIKNSEMVNKAFIKMKYMFKLDIKNEEFNYFIKILDLLKEKKVRPLLFILPVNYMYGSRYYGSRFNLAYDEVVNQLEYQINSREFKLLNLSYMLDEEYFLDKSTLDESISYDGRRMVCNEIVNYYINDKEM